MEEPVIIVGEEPVKREQESVIIVEEEPVIKGLESVIIGLQPVIMGRSLY